MTTQMLRRPWNYAIFDRVLALLPFIVLLIAWELFSLSGVLSEFLLPRCTTVLARIGEDLASGELISELLVTVQRALTGYALAALFGVSTGIIMSTSKIARWFFEPILSVAFPTPKIAFMPIFMLWLGLGNTSKIALVMLSCYFIISTNSYAAALGVDKQLIWAARSLGTSPRRILTQIVLPAATPQIFTGLQIALPMALIITMAAEMIMGGGGLGGQLQEVFRYADSVGLFAGIVEIAFIGTVLIGALARLRRRLLVWHTEASSRSA